MSYAIREWRVIGDLWVMDICNVCGDAHHPYKVKVDRTVRADSGQSAKDKALGLGVRAWAGHLPGISRHPDPGRLGFLE